MMGYPSAISKGQHNRSAYTLIEMLIASGLVAVLMSVAWGLMTLYAGMLTAGRSGAAEQQLARSLFKLLADDARRVVIPQGSEVVESSLEQLEGAPDSSFQSDLEPAGFIPSTDDEIASPSFGAKSELTATAEVEFFGDESMLRITGLKSPDFETTSPNPEDAVSTDVLAVASSTGDNASELGESHLSTVVYQFEQPSSERPSEGQLPAGLHRVEIDAQYALAQLAAETGEGLNDGMLSTLLFGQLPSDLGAQQATAELVEHEHAPEVVRCRFRYFDGSSWRTDWNSTSQDDLPRALHIQLWLVSAAEVDVIQRTLNPNPTSNNSAVSDAPPTVGLVVDESDPLRAIKPRLYERLILLSWNVSPASESEADEFGNFDTLQARVVER